jgi:uncharacterized protein
VGLFMMYMPPFGQWLMAAAMVFRVNLPIAVALVFITNPITIPPMFYGAYLLGASVLGQAVAPFDLDFWAEPANWLTILSPLALGCPLCAIACSVLGYFGVRLAWRWHVLRHPARRRARHQAAAVAAPAPSPVPMSGLLRRPKLRVGQQGGGPDRQTLGPKAAVTLPRGNVALGATLSRPLMACRFCHPPSLGSPVRPCLDTAPPPP